MLRRRRRQQVKWLRTMIEERFLARLRTDPRVKARLPTLEAAVADGSLLAESAVEEIAALFGP